MKKLTLVLPLLLLFGCAECPPTPPVQGQGYACWASTQSVLNNSGYVLDIFQDGALVCKNLAIGQVYRVRPFFFARTVAFAVVGHNPDDSYVGCNDFIFQYNCPETWIVSHLYTPQNPR